MVVMAIDWFICGRNVTARDNSRENANESHRHTHTDTRARLTNQSNQSGTPSRPLNQSPTCYHPLNQLPTPSHPLNQSPTPSQPLNQSPTPSHPLSQSVSSSHLGSPHHPIRAFVGRKCVAAFGADDTPVNVKSRDLFCWQW